MNSCKVYAQMKSLHWAFTLITSTSLAVPCSTLQQSSQGAPLSATHGIQWRLAAIPLVFIILRIWDTVQNTTSIIASDYVNRGCTNVALQKELFCLAILQVCNLYMHMPIDISFQCIFGAPVIATYKYYSRFHHSIYAIIMTTIVCCRQLENLDTFYRNLYMERYHHMITIWHSVVFCLLWYCRFTIHQMVVGCTPLQAKMELLSYKT